MRGDENADTGHSDIRCRQKHSHILRSAPILEPRLSRGDPHSRTALHESYSGLGSPIFGVTISTRLRGRLPTGHPVGRAHIPAEDGGRGRRRPGR
ncbi:hypothetical protein OPAG_08413 [Rhodococcus opacus PD630]|nr:hypothetical protein OPAG_08413 [Rhodococcus opacus PD630]